MELYFANAIENAIENNVQLQLGKKSLSFSYVKFCISQENSHHVIF